MASGLYTVRQLGHLTIFVSGESISCPQDAHLSLALDRG